VVDKILYITHYQLIKIIISVDIITKSVCNTIITYPASFIQKKYEHFQHPIIFIISFIKKLNIEYNNKCDVDMLINLTAF